MCAINAAFYRFEYLYNEYSFRNESIKGLHVILCGEGVSTQETATLGHVSVTQLSHDHLQVRFLYMTKRVISVLK